MKEAHELNHGTFVPALERMREPHTETQQQTPSVTEPALDELLEKAIEQYQIRDLDSALHNFQQVLRGYR